MASYLDARSHEGEWLLRIDDIDIPRIVSGASSQILRQLEFLGFEWSGDVFYQSSRLAAYDSVFDKLRQANRVYACNCSRRLLAETVRHGPLGYIYNARCRDRELPFQRNAVRIVTNTSELCLEDRIQGKYCQQLAYSTGDFVIRRRDGIYAYHLATVVDDWEQGITHVVRGTDLLGSTPRQIWLQQCLGAPRPGYAHVPIVINPDGQKLSKQTHAEPLVKERALASLIKAWQLLGQPALPEQPVDPGEFWDMAETTWEFTRIGRVPRYEDTPRRQPI